MKSLLVAICIISIAFGYIIGKSSSSSSEETQSASPVEARHDRSKSRVTRTRNNGDNALLDSILGGRPISAIPAADLVAIFIKLSKHDPNADDFSRAEQSFQLQLLLAKLSATDLTDIANELSSDSNEYLHIIVDIISALAGKDPNRAMDWISTHESSSILYQEVLSTMAEDDPLKASSLLRSALIDGKIAKRIGFDFVLGQIARSTAKHGADPFFGYLDSLPKELQTGLINGSMPCIPENDHIKFLDQVHQRIQDGRLSGLSMEYTFFQAMTENKAAATEWLKNLPENEQKNYFRIKAAASLFGSGDKESAFEWMKEAIAASPGSEKEIINIAIRNLQSSTPEGIPAFANLLPDGEKFTAGDIHYSMIYGHQAIPALASAFSDPNEKSIFVANSLKEVGQATDGGSLSLNSNDLDILSHQISDMGFTGQNAARVNEAIEVVKNQLSPKN